MGAAGSRRRQGAGAGARRGASLKAAGAEPHHNVTPLFGQYRWDTHTDRWAWSHGMFVVHGYPGAVITPTTDLVLQHKYPATRERAENILNRARHEPSSYVNHHHIIDANGQTRTVLTVGTSRPGAEGGLVSAGFMADLTDAERLAGTAAIAAAIEGRAVINQAQGAVMALCGLHADAALAMLVWYSQNHNVKLATLCRRLVADLTRHGPVANQHQLSDLLCRAANTAPSTADRPA